MTLTMVLMLWLAGSFLEYKIISRQPTLKRFFRGIPGVAISIAISFAVASVLGLQGGVVAGMAAILGLATNEITFKLFSWMSVRNAYVKQRVDGARQFHAEHPKLTSHAVATLRGGLKTIAGLILVIVYLVGLPSRVIDRTRRLVGRIRPA